MHISEPLAQFVFSPSAVREYFSRQGKLASIRLKIENGMVFFKPIEDDKSSDVIILTPRENRNDCYANIDAHATASAHLMDTLVRAGLTNEEPYFRLSPMDRGWIGVTHVAGSQPPAVPNLKVVQLISQGLVESSLTVLETAFSAAAPDDLNVRAYKPRLLEFARRLIIQDPQVDLLQMLRTIERALGLMPEAERTKIASETARSSRAILRLSGETVEQVVTPEDVRRALADDPEFQDILSPNKTHRVYTDDEAQRIISAYLAS